MLKQLTEELNQLLSLKIITKEDENKFYKRITEGKLTQDENKESHICVYFAAFDPHARQVFIGRHRKSGLWLFNGGHIDKGETLHNALKREISEEWGISIDLKLLSLPSLLTLTRTKENLNQKCKWHFDIWYFVKVNKYIFFPVREKLEKEFSKMKWLYTKDAIKLVIDPNTIRTLELMEKQFV